MRLFTLHSNSVIESHELDRLGTDTQAPDSFYWLSCTRLEFEQQLGQIQATLQNLCGLQLVDLHVSDLLNQQLPSRYDFTSQYDLLVFRRLSAGTGQGSATSPGQPLERLPSRGGPPILRRIDTSPVGFAVFDQVLLTVHPSDCTVPEAYAAKLLGAATHEARAAGARLPSSPADLMLRIINQMVDGFLELRRDTVSLPDRSTATREYILHPGAVAVIPLLDDGRVVLVRQYRYPVSRVLLELPAGKLDAGEAHLACGQRELLEETGYRATEWAYAGAIHNAAAYCTESIHLWFARGLQAGEQSLDVGEFVEVCRYTEAELDLLASRGELPDVKTLIGLQWLQRWRAGAWTLDWQPA